MIDNLLSDEEIIVIANKFPYFHYAHEFEWKKDIIKYTSKKTLEGVVKWLDTVDTRKDPTELPKAWSQRDIESYIIGYRIAREDTIQTIKQSLEVEK